MSDEQVIEMLMEGGNSVAVNREETVKWTRDELVPKQYAEKIDMTQVQRTLLRNEFINTFGKLNDLVKKETGKPLWNDFNTVKSGLAFNGSSTWMFSDEVSDEEFTKHKPTVGDIDITVPRNRMVDLFDVLLKYEDTMLGNIEYIGNNRQSSSEGQQINAVFKFDVPGTEYIAYPQVDFEPSDYEDDKPTEWDSFSHNSSWDDIKKGFKGVTHKYALTIMAHIVSKDFTVLPDIMLDSGADKETFWETTEAVEKAIGSFSVSELPNKKSDGYDETELVDFLKSNKFGRVQKIRSKTKETHVVASHYLAFSVGRGVRLKYRSLLTKDNKPIMIDNKMVLVAIASPTASYETMLKPMFELFFGYIPNDDDIKKMKSFIGVIELLKESKLKNRKAQYEQFLDELVREKLWGHPPYFYTHAQELERDSKELDAEIKWAMVNYIMKELQVGNLVDLKKIANTYYENWVGNASDDISESIKPKKFSAIFESVEKQTPIVPRGYAHWDESYLIDTKSDILKNTFGLTVREVTEFIRSAPTSMNRKKVFHDKSISTEMQRFLNYEAPKENPNSSKNIINKIIKRGY